MAKKRPKNGATPADDLPTVKAALDQADQDMEDALAGGDSDEIALARQALLIAIANYITALANAG